MSDQNEEQQPHFILTNAELLAGMLAGGYQGSAVRVEGLGFVDLAGICATKMIEMQRHIEYLEKTVEAYHERGDTEPS